MMDLDLANSSISKKKGLRSLWKIIQFLSTEHRKETHSLFYAFSLMILFSPFSLYLSLADNSSFIDNSIIIFLGVLSHLVLDMFNKKPVPLFYFPKINTIKTASLYTWSSFFSVIIQNISDFFYNNSIKYRLTYFNTISIFLKKIALKVNLNFWLLVSSKKEFIFFTLPLFLWLISMIYFNKDLLHSKIVSSSNIILHNVIIWLVLLIYSVINNYLFIDNGWFKDFLISLKNKPKYWKISDLKKIFWEWNFTKIIIIVTFLLSVFYNSQLFISNYWDFIWKIILIFNNINNPDNWFFENIIIFTKDILVHLIL